MIWCGAHLLLPASTAVVRYSDKLNVVFLQTLNDTGIPECSTRSQNTTSEMFVQIQSKKS